MKNYLTKINNLNKELKKLRKSVKNGQSIQLDTFQGKVEEISHAIKKAPPIDIKGTEEKVSELIANLDLLANELKSQLIINDKNNKTG